jgi:hypothetical protein
MFIGDDPGDYYARQFPGAIAPIVLTETLKVTALYNSKR